MAVADNQAQNDIKVNKSQPKPKPAAKKEELEPLEALRKKYLLEEGPGSQKYKALDRILRNKI